MVGTCAHESCAELRQQDAREDVGLLGAAVRQDRVARLRHVRRIGAVADHLQAEIGLHRRADVEGAVMKQRPAAMLALDAAQIDGDLALELEVVRLAEIVAQQDVFRRDRGVGFQFEDPVAVVALPARQRLRGAIDVVVQPVRQASTCVQAPPRSEHRRPCCPTAARPRSSPAGRCRSSRRRGTGWPTGCAPAAGARPAPGSRRRWRASP